MNYSKQRELILQAVTQTKSHPTAEIVYNQLKTNYPRLSLATVYRNLNQLCELGTMQSLHLPNSPERFDANITPHCHFYCNKCGAVLDLDGAAADWRRLVDNTLPHLVTGCEIVLYGSCEKCLSGQPIG
ncbi:MAG: transcriptional repressor [Oscillospiraceae bacterium]